MFCIIIASNSSETFVLRTNIAAMTSGENHRYEFGRNRDCSPVYTTTFLARYPFEFGPGGLKFATRHAPFLSCKWKNSWHEYPKTYGGRDYLSTWSRHPYILGHSCHEFFHLHDKNGGCRPKILCTGAKFKRVPCQKNCRVNRACSDYL